ncbi:hypothetical protein CN198_27875 [Sinorhizobium meliloti]|nr:hypothetical protein CN223_24545 [Sinorhizobium meliloti]RVH62102.1 hypothetical protein CN198_27875 [Sinorhizobium meliloti]RVP03234.1 hypothetical protein CN083_28015 [Sinorhizobium meliloti]
MRFAVKIAPHPNPLPVKRGEGTSRTHALDRNNAREAAAGPFAPPAARRCRQADEGRFHPQRKLA